MIGIVIVTHGKLAEGFKDSVEMIMGEQSQFNAIGLFPSTDMENFAGVIADVVHALDTGEGTLVFVDMFGASPCNFAATGMAEDLALGKKRRIITGVNLPMLIECLSMRTFVNDLDKLYRSMLTTGKEGIKELLTVLSVQDEE